jgi:hypothetical protein
MNPLPWTSAAGPLKLCKYYIIHMLCQTKPGLFIPDCSAPTVPDSFCVALGWKPPQMRHEGVENRTAPIHERLDVS